MSKLPEPNQQIKVTKEVVKIGKYSLLLTTYESQEKYTFFIGSHTLYCLHAWILKKGSFFEECSDITKGYLDKIQFNQHCSLENNFTRGLDITLVLKFMLTYINKKFPQITRLTFNDGSSRTCDNGETMSLAALSYLTTGKTWQEKNFGAFLESDAEREFREKESKFQE